VLAVALGGLAAILVAVLWMALFPQLRRVDSPEAVALKP